MDLSSQLTEAEQLAAALRENRELKASLAKLEKSLESARHELQYFVYAASHDLQEPLRMVLTYTQLLERQLSEDGQAREFAGFVIDGARRMNALVQGLLAYSRAGSTHRRGDLKLSASLQWAMLKLADVIGRSQADIRVGELPELFADESEIAHVFELLISNAIQFHGEGKPHIEVGSEQGSEECIIFVRDDGPGIEERFYEEVFQPFKRLHAKGVAGSGLGLAICEKIIKAHGGRIWAEGNGERGLAVKFVLPT